MSEMDVSTEGNGPSEDHQEVPTPPAVECNDPNVTAEKVSPEVLLVILLKHTLQRNHHFFGKEQLIYVMWELTDVLSALLSLVSEKIVLGNNVHYGTGATWRQA
ncbi:hypothetical protein CDAR_171092 [Caerostris darwini]|uniref:Uncharacterized protein n=1 Tax=Caerostris darwini TaxID=1538125 RepID=A0AAV4WL92_9ARAC|nr:hypothetical protein CDAR_171092 [Caerostris darwini]